MIRHVLVAAFAWSVLVAVGATQSSLEQALKDAKAELAAERKRIAEEESVLQRELDGLIEKRNERSDALVDLRLTLAKRKKSSRANDLREQREALRSEVSGLDRDLAEARRLVDEYRPRIRDLFETLPPASSRPDVGETLASLLSTCSTILAGGGTAEVFDHQVTTPAGNQIAAEVLRLGEVAWAYRAKDDGTIALAMKSPEGATGYRWNVDLTPAQRSQIGAAIDAVKAGEDTMLPLPFDVTQQLTVEPVVSQRTLLDTVKAGGPIMFPLAAVAILAVLLIVLRFVWFLTQGGRSTRLAERVVGLCSQGKFDDAHGATTRARGPVARALGACLDKRHDETKAREDAIQEALLHEMPRVERFLSTIGILAAIAPLLGLLGTVTGMIVTFEMIATFGTGDPRMMAGGISQALITTAAGLIVAIPVLLAHSFLSAMADRMIADTERYSATLLNVIEQRSDA